MWITSQDAEMILLEHFSENNDSLEDVYVVMLKQTEVEAVFRFTVILSRGSEKWSKFSGYLRVMRNGRAVIRVGPITSEVDKASVEKILNKKRSETVSVRA